MMISEDVCEVVEYFRVLFRMEREFAAFTCEMGVDVNHFDCLFEAFACLQENAYPSEDCVMCSLQKDFFGFPALVVDMVDAC